MIWTEWLTIAYHIAVVLLLLLYLFKFKKQSDTNKIQMSFNAEIGKFTGEANQWFKKTEVRMEHLEKAEVKMVSRIRGLEDER